jgi:thiamine biosynthesis lipoprotein
MAFTGGASIPVRRWRGVAMGAGASLIFAHPDADRLIGRATAEIDRLEDIFSLYRANSALSRLNRDGRLETPPLELLSILSLSGAVHRRTGGAFDPTIQPLWALYAHRYAAGAEPSDAEIEEARARTGWSGVRFDSSAITFAHTGMALTLNGIAQGYVADRIADLLHAEGLEDVLVDMGEIRALGHNPDGAPWRIGLADENGRAAPARSQGLSGGAIATSAPLGTVFDASGRVGHIIDPRTGRPGGRWRQVSVMSPTAARADALSTAFALMTRPEIDGAMNKGETVMLR